MLKFVNCAYSTLTPCICKLRGFVNKNDFLGHIFTMNVIITLKYNTFETFSFLNYFNLLSISQE